MRTDIRLIATATMLVVLILIGLTTSDYTGISYLANFLLGLIVGFLIARFR